MPSLLEERVANLEIHVADLHAERLELVKFCKLVAQWITIMDSWSMGGKPGDPQSVNGLLERVVEIAKGNHPGAKPNGANDLDDKFWKTGGTGVPATGPHDYPAP